MNKKLSLVILAVFGGCLLATLGGCEKNPTGKLVNPTSETSGKWSGVWTLYDDDIRTGGNIRFFTTAEGQTINFKSQNGPHSGAYCLHFRWDGSNTTEYSSGNNPAYFVGFSLIVAQTEARYNLESRDLTQGLFSKITFWARGTLDSNVALRLEAYSEDPNFHTYTDGYPGVWSKPITTEWQRFEIPLDPTVNSLSHVRDYVKIILKYKDVQNQPVGFSHGGDVYIDDIQLTR